jgi:hypothetical protein
MRNRDRHGGTFYSYSGKYVQNPPLTKRVLLRSIARMISRALTGPMRFVLRRLLRNISLPSSCQLHNVRRLIASNLSAQIVRAEIPMASIDSTWRLRRPYPRWSPKVSRLVSSNPKAFIVRGEMLSRILAVILPSYACGAEARLIDSRSKQT